MKTTTFVILAAVVGMVGCTRVVHRADGMHDVPRQVGEVNFFGTDQSAMYLDRCQTRVHRAIGADEYLNCAPVTNYKFASSASGGPQVLSGALAGLGLGLGLAHSGSDVIQNANQSNRMDVRASTVNPKPVK